MSQENHVESCSKMMLNDVADKKLDLPQELINKLYEKYGEYTQQFVINLLQRQVEKQVELRYRGRLKIKSDVLKRFKAIADHLQSQTIYPNLRKNVVERIVKDILVDPDERVLKWYVDSIDLCIRQATGKYLSYYQNCDVSAFVFAVQQHATTSFSEDNS